MPLNIKDADTHAMAKRLASLTGESLTTAVEHAIQAKLQQVERTKGGAPLAEELDHNACRADQIIGYDESGLPA